MYAQVRFLMILLTLFISELDYELEISVRWFDEEEQTGIYRTLIILIETYVCYLKFYQTQN